MPTSYACAFCGDLKQREIAFRCGLCSSPSVDEVDGAIICEACGHLRAGDLSIECGICGAEELAAAEAAL